MSRLTTRMFETWFDTQFNLVHDYKLHVAVGRMPDNPDRACAINRQNAPRDLNDGIFEVLIYRILSRGRSQRHEDAENIANDIDRFLDGRLGFDIGDVYIQSIYTEVKPRMLTITDPQSRFNFTADYKVVASKD